MKHAPELLGGRDTRPIAGSIRPAESTLEDILARWEAHLAARCTENSVAVMLGEVRRAARAQGWTGAHDLTNRSIVEYMDSREGWAPTTYRRNLSVFRSLTRWLVASEELDRDPLALAQAPTRDGGPGARAATTDEARAIVRAAWLREQTDGRARRSARALYWACLFLTGSRISEPAGWRWSDLSLDEEPAVIVWRPESQKNGRRAELALAPELAAMLRAWRDHSADLSNMVFPVAPAKRSFADDRARAGVAKLDPRGRPISAHSARKWFASTLTTAGVHPRILDRLMRHAGRVEDRYFDCRPEEMAAALALLPKIWPEQTFAPHGFRKLSPKSGAEAVDVRIHSADAVGAKAMFTNPPTSHSEPRPAAGEHGLSNLVAPVGRGSLCDANGVDPVSGDGPRNGEGGHDNAGGANPALAAFLAADAARQAALARLIGGGQ